MDENKDVLLDKPLSFDQKLVVAAKLLGYRKMPPDINTFLNDEFYLGNLTKNLYPFWVEQLNDIFPTPIHTRYPIVIVKGAIGTGKSTFSRIATLYQRARLDHLINPYDSLGIMEGKMITFSFFMPNIDAVHTEFITPITEWMSRSPYFNGGMLNNSGQYLFNADAQRSNSAIGKDIIMYVLSEMNFIPYHIAKQKLSSAFTRWSSRFERFKDYFGMIIIDTSSRGDESIADEFAQNNPYGDYVKVINTNQWEVRKHQNYYGRKGWFRVFAGDSLHPPFIETPERPITMDMDADRIVKVPEELRPDFELDIIQALQDKAGISTSSSDVFFQDTTGLKKCFKLPMYTEDVIKVDFYDKTDKLIYHFDRYLRDIPDDKIIYVRYDIGVTGDNTGIAICYFDKWKVYDSDRNIRQPILIVPLAVGLNRFEGQETPVYHLFEFIMDLNERFEIGRFTADQFASRQLIQDLRREGIPSDYLSVDRTDEAYVFTKTLINNGLISFPENKLLENEFASLRRVGRKIDHPKTASKDIADAVAGAAHSCYLDIDHAGQLSNKYKISKHTDYLEIRNIDSMDTFERRFRELF
jgi:hypothetical protein